MDKVIIEMTTESGYKSSEYTVEEAVNLLNEELENERTIWIDGRPHFGDMITKDEISVCKKEISVTNKLIGG